MTQPPANPPADPDAGLSDEEKAAKGKFKGWFAEAMTEFIAANAPADPPPERTKKKGGSIMDTLFGGAGGSGD